MWFTQLPMIMLILGAIASTLILISFGATYNAQRYYRVLPTLPYYPDNHDETKKVAQAMWERTDEEVLLFRETNEDGVRGAFMREFPECTKTLSKATTTLVIGAITLLLKVMFNRPRPVQVNSDIKPEPSFTAKTPAFPSGHALASYYAARVVAKQCPEKAAQAFELADRCAHARVIAGLHYPSDGSYSKHIMNAVPDWLIV